MKREILAAAVAALLASGLAGAQAPKKISSDFTPFAGSPENADSLVTGLRSGSDITLSFTDPAGVTTTNTFTPATGNMGNGNVRIALVLARQQLAGVGITQPTGEQIQASLIGGDVTVIGPNGPQTTTLQGVTTLRAGGMGWGRIAQTYGVKLGPLMKAANAPVVTPVVAPASGVTNASGAPASGVTTAAGSNPGKGNAIGRGVTTAAGGASGAAGQGHGNAFGRGITTGASGAPGNSGNAGSQGKGGGKGG
jgi:hypothetical protein